MKHITKHKLIQKISNIDLSNFYTKSETYNKDEVYDKQQTLSLFNDESQPSNANVIDIKEKLDEWEGEGGVLNLIKEEILNSRQFEGIPLFEVLTDYIQDIDEFADFDKTINYKRDGILLMAATIKTNNLYDDDYSYTYNIDLYSSASAPIVILNIESNNNFNKSKLGNITTSSYNPIRQKEGFITITKTHKITKEKEVFTAPHTSPADESQKQTLSELGFTLQIVLMEYKGKQFILDVEDLPVVEDE